MAAATRGARNRGGNRRGGNRRAGRATRNTRGPAARRAGRRR